MASIRFFQRPLVFLLVFTTVFSALACYSRVGMQKTRLTQISSANHLRFMLIDAGAPAGRIWQISNAKFEQNALSGHLDRISAAAVRQIATIDDHHAMETNNDLVLIYLTSTAGSFLADTISTRINYQDITRIEVFEPDAGKTIGLILGIVGGITAIGLIVVIIACNCPHVYAESPDGNLHLAGSLYSGAIYPQLERSDWLSLKGLQPIDHQYHIRLANQEGQRQHTDLLALEVLDHAPGLQPVFDKYGQIHTLSTLQAPLAATDVSGRDVRDEVSASDEKVFVGDLGNTRPEATERLTLSFAKPALARQAKLMINAKNSDWLDYTYFEFQNALGRYAGQVDRKYRRLPATKNLAWAERQKIPLAVWLETWPGHWQKIDYFNLAGASAFRRDVLLIDLAQLSGDTVRLRLEFGFHFWEIDYAALDFSNDQPVRQTTLRPLSAFTQTGEDLATSLTDDDGHYYDQFQSGDEARIAFEVPPLAPGDERSLVLQAKGHYEVLHRPAAGRPGLLKLQAWENENALPRLSRDRWLAAQHLTLNR